MTRNKTNSFTPNIAFQMFQASCMKKDEIMRYALKKRVNLDNFSINYHSIAKAKYRLIFLKMHTIISLE